MRACALVAELQAEASMPRDAAPQEAMTLEVLHLVAFLLEVAAVHAHLVRVGVRVRVGVGVGIRARR